MESSGKGFLIRLYTILGILASLAVIIEFVAPYGHFNANKAIPPQTNHYEESTPHTSTPVITPIPATISPERSADVPPVSRTTSTYEITINLIDAQLNERPGAEISALNFESTLDGPAKLPSTQ